MNFEIVSMTPEAAQEILLRNEGNRPLRSITVLNYMKAMSQGAWQCNGEAIKIAKSGRLLDGQHRLTAIVRSGVTVTIAVARNVDESAFKTIDTGMRRSVAQIISMAGVSNASTIASACRWIAFYERKSGITAGQVSSQEVLSVIDRHPLIHHFASMHKHSRNLLPSAAVAVFTLAAEKYGQNRIDIFVSDVSSGVGLSRKMPAYELRERMIKSSNKTSKLSQIVIFVFTLKAVKAYCENRFIGHLRYSADEPLVEL